jgi:hypothetical protein
VTSTSSFKETKPTTTTTAAATTLREPDPLSSSQTWLPRRPVEIDRFMTDVCQPILDASSYSQCQLDVYPYSRLPSTNTSQPMKSTMDRETQTDPILFMDANTWLSWLSPETLDQWMEACLQDPSFHQIVHHIERHFLHTRVPTI